MAGPISVLLLSLFGFILFRLTRKTKNFQQLFFFWLGTMGMAYFFGCWPIGAIAKENYTSAELYIGLAAVAAWYDLPMPLLIALIFIAGILSLLVGILLVRPVLTLSFSHKLINNYYGRRQMFYQFIAFPILCALLIIAGVSFPYMLIISGLHFAALFLMMFSVFIYMNYYNNVIRIYKNNTLHIMRWVPVVVMVIIITVIKIMGLPT